MAAWSRRRFLEVIAVGAAAVGAGCGAQPAGTPPAGFGDVSAGNLASLPVGTLRAVPGAPVAIGRDAQGLYAMTLTCTHAGCDMSRDGSITASGIYCRCHGSRFDTNGGVVTGPATEALAHFAVEVDKAGAITVHGGTEVGAATRTVVA